MKKLRKKKKEYERGNLVPLFEITPYHNIVGYVCWEEEKELDEKKKMKMKMKMKKKKKQSC